MTSIEVILPTKIDPVTGLPFAKESGQYRFKATFNDNMYTELKHKVRTFFGVSDNTNFHFRKNDKHSPFIISSNEELKMVVSGHDGPQFVNLVVVVEEEEEEIPFSLTLESNKDPETGNMFALRYGRFNFKVKRGDDMYDELNNKVRNFFGISDNAAFSLYSETYGVCGSTNAFVKTVVNSRKDTEGVVELTFVLLSITGLKGTSSPFYTFRKGRYSKQLQLPSRSTVSVIYDIVSTAFKLKPDSFNVYFRPIGTTLLSVKIKKRDFLEDTAYFVERNNIHDFKIVQKETAKAKEVEKEAIKICLIYNGERYDMPFTDSYEKIAETVRGIWLPDLKNFKLCGNVNSGEFHKLKPCHTFDDDAGLKQWIDTASKNNDELYIFVLRYIEGYKRVLPMENVPFSIEFKQLKGGKSGSSISTWRLEEGAGNLKHSELTRTVCELFAIDIMNESFSVFHDKWGHIEDQADLDTMLGIFKGMDTMRLNVSVHPNKTFKIISDGQRFVMHRDCEMGPWDILLRDIKFTGLLERLKIASPDAVGFTATISDKKHIVWSQTELDIMMGHTAISSYYGDIPFDIDVTPNIKRTPYGEDRDIEIVFCVDGVDCPPHTLSLKSALDLDLLTFSKYAKKIAEENEGALSKCFSSDSGEGICDQDSLGRAIRRGLSVGSTCKFSLHVSKWNKAARHEEC
jgi:hypothetical protein